MKSFYFKLSVSLIFLLTLNVSAQDWNEIIKATASDAAASDYFGFSVSISGDTAIVGAAYDDDDGSDSGSAYIFTRSGNSWIQQAKLTASDAASGDQFGLSVSISGDTAIIGAHGGFGLKGCAYVFIRSGNTWTQQTKLTASDAASGDQFGYNAISIFGDTAIIGARGDGNWTGSAYVFTRSGNTWTQQAKLTVSDGVSNDQFGYYADIFGDTAILGAVGYERWTGAAYVFTRSGSTWTQQAKLTASDGASNDYFGLRDELTSSLSLSLFYLLLYLVFNLLG